MFGQNKLSPEILIQAYAQGIFPMGGDHGEIRWYSPDPRCIFDLSNINLPRRLLRTYRQNKFELRVNSAWTDVLAHCADRSSTWITEEIFLAYTRLHQLGLAHSVEAYKDGSLVGGLYGVSLGGAFMGESMFHIERDASKVCLIYLIERLKERGYVVLDSQYMTPHLATLGAIEITRQEYLEILMGALTLDCRFAD